MVPNLRPPSRADLECTHCGRPIEAGDEAVDFFHGVAVPNRDNRNELEVESSAACSGPAVLHPKCLVDYVLCNVWDDIDGLYRAETYCAGCDAKLGGTYEDKGSKMAVPEQIWKADVTSLREDNQTVWRLVYDYYERLKQHGAPPALVSKMVAISDRLGEVDRMIEQLGPYFPDQPEK